MDKYFLCLANSYKHDYRRLAGVEVTKTSNGFEVIKDSWGHPICFRPVHRHTKAGAIPNEEALNIALFDVIYVENVEHCPDGAQVENHFYDCLSKVGSMEPTDEMLASLSKTNRRVLFGNTIASITHEQYNRMDYSILMVKATDVNCYLKERDDKQLPQPRMRFIYNDIRYDFPVTDPAFRHLMKEDLNKANAYDSYYLALSLSAICEDKHYKLVAGVIYKGKQSDDSQRLPIIPYTSRETFYLLQKGMTLEQIAQHRELALPTIKSHLLPYFSNGMLDIHQYVSADIIQKVHAYKQQHPEEDKLKPIYEYFNGSINYDDIRFVVAALKH